MANLSEQFDIYARNMTNGMCGILADDLGIDPSVIPILGVGFYPAEQVFIFAERDASGEVCGLVRRSYKGNKYTVKGSKRGLTYAPTEHIKNTMVTGVRWVRCSPTSGISCPICGRTKWCMVSSDNPDDPQAVLCTKIEEGSEPDYRSKDGESFLHIRKEGGRLNGSLSLLPPSKYPVLVVEGQTDTLAAMSLGFVAVGKPSALGGGRMLRDLLGKRDVIIIGENDGGDGEKGMHATYKMLVDICKSVKGILPPDGVKDLREWVKRTNVTRDQLLEYAKQYGDCERAVSRHFEDSNVHTFSERFLESEYTRDGALIIRKYGHDFWVWNGHGYKNMPPDQLADQVRTFARSATMTRNLAKTITIDRFPTTLAFVNNVVAEIQSMVSIRGHAPQWIDDTPGDSADLIVFQNGVLDVSTWEFHEPTPMFFSMYTLPYDYDPDIDYSWWSELVADILDNDEESIQLLQQWFGYNMLADISQEKMMVFIGPTRSGKGTIQHGLAQVLGKDQIGACSLSSLARRFGYEPLVGKLAAFVGDTTLSASTRTHEVLDKLLQVIGQDAVDIDRKGVKATSSVKLHTRFTIATNRTISLADKAGALMARICLIEFTKSYIGREDRHLKQKIERHAPEIAVWALCGLADLRANGKFVEPRRSQRQVKRMANFNSFVREFLDSYCEIEDGAQVPWRTFLTAYKNWCRWNGYHKSSTASIQEDLELAFPDIVLALVHNGRANVKTCIGLRLKPETEDEFLE